MLHSVRIVRRWAQQHSAVVESLQSRPPTRDSTSACLDPLGALAVQHIVLVVQHIVEHIALVVQHFAPAGHHFAPVPHQIFHQIALFAQAEMHLVVKFGAVPTNPQQSSLCCVALKLSENAFREYQLSK